jgi:hypothetical protein
MSGDTEYQSKMDALDLIISVLKDHEKTLDSLIEKLTELVGTEGEPQTKEKAYALGVVEFEDWLDFRGKCKGSELVTFRVESDFLTVEALSKHYLLRYSERFPRIKFHVKKERDEYQIEGYTRSVKKTGLKEILSLFGGEFRCGLKIEHKESKIDVNENEFFIDASFELDKEKVKEWLSWELNVPRENIVAGRGVT